MKKLLLIILISFSGIGLKAQTNLPDQQVGLDSLYSVWQDETQPDSSRLKSITKIAVSYQYTYPDSLHYFAQMKYDFAKSKGLKKQMAQALSIEGRSFMQGEDFEKAFEYYKRSLRLNEEIGDKKGIAGILINIGVLYYYQDNSPQALNYWEKGAAICEEIGEASYLANVLSNIGNIYHQLGQYNKALNHFERSLKVRKSESKFNRAVTLGNIAIIYGEQKDYTKAMDFYQRSMSLNVEIGNKSGSVQNLTGVGSIYMDQGDYIKAMDFFQRSLKIAEGIGNNKGSAINMRSIGEIYQRQGNYPKALEYCKKALLKNQELGVIRQEKNDCRCLYDTYKAMGNGNEALQYLERINVIEDSLNTEETAKQLQQMEFTKVMLADSLNQVAKDIEVHNIRKEEIRKSEKTRNILMGSGLFVLLFAIGIFSRLRYVRISKATLQVEKDRSENLLLNILPADIAAELKEKGRADARDFDMVSILFTDFKGFTAASEKLSAQELVAEINICFEAFDGIMGNYNIEKIKTIGDAYMAAGGLPVPTDTSTKNTVLSALEMQDFITKRKVEMDAKGLPAFEMRVGIHTGPVVAGIVGVKKFAYDIWGDTVNTASRMENSGEVSKVNISQATYELLKGDADFAFESRGKIEVKGKGEIEMYFVSMA